MSTKQPTPPNPVGSPADTGPDSAPPRIPIGWFVARAPLRDFACMAADHIQPPGLRNGTRPRSVTTMSSRRPIPRRGMSPRKKTHPRPLHLSRHLILTFLRRARTTQIPHTTLIPPTTQIPNTIRIPLTVKTPMMPKPMTRIMVNRARPRRAAALVDWQEDLHKTSSVVVRRTVMEAAAACPAWSVD